ncbi:glycosyltransferase family 39 protein [Candidatus Daviesbacteria bacterium]|nr:glycosyltransferase family 39 protein [Candidatus Daviesbacteria bacterium]
MFEFILKRKEFLVGLVLSLSLLWPLFAAPFFTHHDDVQVIRLFEMDKCFKDRQIPCRWVPDLGGLYGYPIFNYYAPLPYYFGEVIYSLTHNFILTVKIMFAFSFITSYIFMYLLAKKFWGKTGGSISAIFYAFAPYHAVDFYIRGAMGEMWGLMSFPAIFWAFANLAEKKSIKNLLIAAIFIGVIISSHNLSAMIFLPFSLVWIGLYYLKTKSNLFLFYSFLSIFLGSLLVSFYLLPAIFEKNLVHLETTVGGYFSYTEHFKGFRKLFLDRFWGYGSSVREVPGGERDSLPYQIGWVHLLGWVLALFTAYKLWHKNKWTSIVIIFSSVSILIAAFMINPRSLIIWRMIDSLKYLQFPWRFLLIITFFISFISGSLLLSLQNRKNLWLTFLILVVVLNFLYFKPGKFINTNDKDYLSGQNWDRIIKRSIFDYLPIFAKEPPAELATERYQILTGDSKIYDFTEGTNWLKFKTETKSHTIIRLSQYYFPNWKIFVDGKEINFEYKDNSLGLMTIILGEGNHNVEARLFDTPIRLLSNYITLVTILLITSLFISQIRSIRKWYFYYKKGIN